MKQSSKKVPQKTNFSEDDLRPFAEKRLRKKRRPRGQAFLPGQGSFQGYRYGFGSRHQLAQSHLRCDATNRSGTRCENPACKVNLAFGIRRCHFHSGPNDPWRIEYRMRRARGEFASSGWNKAKRNRRISKSYLETLEGLWSDAVSDLQRDQRSMHNRLFSRCLDALGASLNMMPQHACIAAEFLVQITIADCLTGKRRYRGTVDVIVQAETAVATILHLPDAETAVGKQQRIRDRHREKVQRKWQRKAKLEALGLAVEPLPGELNGC